MNDTQSTSQVAIFPNAYMGLCIHSEQHHQTVNVHFVDKGQVYYGKYSDFLIDEIDDGCIGVYRTPEDHFNEMIGGAVVDGCTLYTMTER
jgi:hypothetical protein